MIPSDDVKKKKLFTSRPMLPMLPRGGYSLFLVLFLLDLSCTATGSKKISPSVFQLASEADASRANEGGRRENQQHQNHQSM